MRKSLLLTSATLVSFLLTFPYLLAWRSNGPSFSLFGITRDVDQSFYATRMTQADAPDSPRLALTDAAGFAFLRVLYRLTGSPEAAWLLARAILAFLWTLLLYTLLHSTTGKPKAALAGALAITLFGDAAFALGRFGQPPFTTLAESLKSLAMLGGPNNLCLGPTRLLSPAFSFCALLFAASLLPRGAREKVAEGRMRDWVAGFATGLLAYVHTDVWSVGLASLAGLALIRRIHWSSVVIALLVSLPWLIVLSHLDLDFLIRTKADWTRAPDPRALPFFVAGVVALLLALAKPGRGGGEGIRAVAWLGFALLSVALAMNSQILTGLSIQPFHWTLIGLFLSALLAAILIARRSSESRRWDAAIAGIAALALVRGIAWSRAESSTLVQHAQVRDALAWVRQAAPGATFASLSPDAALTLPVYARSDTLAVSDSPVAHDVPTFENAVRLAYSARLLGLERGRFLSLAQPPAPGLDTTAYGPGEEWRVTLGAERVLLPYIFFSDYPRERLKALLAGAWAEAGRRRYSVDYVWVGPFERALLGRAFPGRPEYQNAWIAVYRPDRGLLSRR